jgi:hypothetical protein
MRRLKNFLPIVLIALAVQIFAPIGACWAATIAASDPLAGAVICHGNGAPGAGQVDVPQIAAAIALERDHARVVWIEFAPDRFASRAGSHAQARAPPAIS